MDQRIISLLSRITDEEQRFLRGDTRIDREIYMEGRPNVINSRKLLATEKMITIRPHTRFVHFPKHTHDYVEMIYMCKGSTNHIVNNETVVLKSGELLLLNQSASHEVCRAGENDVAVNFIILPEFFTETLSDIGEEETPLRRFLVDCLCRQNSEPGYLHFCVSDVIPVQNLVENMLFTLTGEINTKRRICSLTMSLLFLQLMSYTEMLSVPKNEQAAVIKILSYTDKNYASGSLSDAARMFGYDVAWISREIKKTTGKTFTQIIQEKRLAQAAFLLRNSEYKVNDISLAVGYENVSYFHRLFFQAFGCSPRTYRLG